MTSLNLTADRSCKILSRGPSDYLAYHRFEAKNSSLPGVVFLGGYKSDMTGTKAMFLDSLCRERQQTFTRFDYFGHGSSTGKFEEGTIGQWLSDSLAVIDELTKGPLILVGSSLGGWLITLATLARPERIQAMIGIASAPDFTEDLIWESLTDSQKKDLTENGLMYIPSSEDPLGLPVTLDFIQEGRQHLVLRKKLEVTCPVHLIHGSHDTDVPVSFSERLMDSVKSQECSLTLIKNGDHRLNTPFALGYLGALISQVSEG